MTLAAANLVARLLLIGVSSRRLDPDLVSFCFLLGLGVSCLETFSSPEIIKPYTSLTYLGKILNLIQIPNHNILFNYLGFFSLFCHALVNLGTPLQK